MRCTLMRYMLTITRGSQPRLQSPAMSETIYMCIRHLAQSEVGLATRTHNIATDETR
jgi:hypothetical protein